MAAMHNFTDPTRPGFIPPTPPPSAFWKNDNCAAESTDCDLSYLMPAPHARLFDSTTKTDMDRTLLITYHICRICMRPRSEHYHRKHPIPVDGVPPPPGICRRCRFISETEVVENVAVEKDVYRERGSRGESTRAMLSTTIWPNSGLVTLGVGCLVPERDRVRQLSPAGERVHAPVDTWRPIKHDHHSDKGTTTQSKGPTSIPTSHTRSKTEALYLETRGRESKPVDYEWHTEHIHEGDMRRIARDEVEKYRRAERLLQSHPNAYAHGRMVSVGHNANEGSKHTQGQTEPSKPQLVRKQVITIDRLTSEEAPHEKASQKEASRNNHSKVAAPVIMSSRDRRDKTPRPMQGSVRLGHADTDRDYIEAFDRPRSPPCPTQMPAHLYPSKSPPTPRRMREDDERTIYPFHAGGSEQCMSHYIPDDPEYLYIQRTIRHSSPPQSHVRFARLPKRAHGQNNRHRSRSSSCGRRYAVQEERHHETKVHTSSERLHDANENYRNPGERSRSHHEYYDSHPRHRSPEPPQSRFLQKAWSESPSREQLRGQLRGREEAAAAGRMGRLDKEVTDSMPVRTGSAVRWDREIETVKVTRPGLSTVKDG